MSSPEHLARVRRAADDKRHAERAYRMAVAETHQAIREACAAGCSFAEVGRAAGISRNGARKVTI